MTLDAAAAGVNGGLGLARGPTGDGVGVDAVVLVPTHAAGLGRGCNARWGTPRASGRGARTRGADGRRCDRRAPAGHPRRTQAQCCCPCRMPKACARRSSRQRRRSRRRSPRPCCHLSPPAARGPRWELWLAADARVPLARAQRIEREIDAARAGKATTAAGGAGAAGPAADRARPATDDAIGPDPAQQAALEPRLGAAALAGDARGRRPRRRRRRPRGCGNRALRSVLSARGIAIGEVERAARRHETTLQPGLARVLSPQPSAAAGGSAAPAVRSMPASASPE